MSELAPLISDLALILICAGVMTLVFKRLKQPLVLGYIVAGFLASPHFTLTPSVIDTASIHTWSEIGVIFLLFALGLEFSFKKLVKVGGTAVIAACAIIFSMIMIGMTVGWTFGWKSMDCLYLGGMLAVSITEGVSVKCGLAKNPATIYPNTKGCLRRLKTSVITPAQIKISAKSLIRGANSDICFSFTTQM